MMTNKYQVGDRVRFDRVPSVQRIGRGIDFDAPGTITEVTKDGYTVKFDGYVNGTIAGLTDDDLRPDH